MEFIVGLIIGFGAASLLAYAFVEQLAKFKRR